MTIEPKLSEATLSSDYRIYQDQTVLEVLREVLEPYAPSVEWRLYEQDKAHRRPKRDYCVLNEGLIFGLNTVKITIH